MSSGSEYRVASDNLLARVSGDWAKEKLYYTQRYMSIFNGAMKRKWDSRVYIDLLAGSGRCVLREDPSDEFDGSPLLSLKLDHPFSDVMFVEQDSNLADALRARLRTAGYDENVVRTADANSNALIDEVRRLCRRPTLALTFVDFLGLEVSFDTLRRLSASIRMDLLLTFQVNDLTRNVPQVLAGEHPPDRLNAFFGTPAWRDVAIALQTATIAAPDLATALTDYYCDRLATLGLMPFGNSLM